MASIIYILNKKLVEYLENKISKEALNKEVINAFHKLLKNEKFYEVKYLAIYPFLSELTDCDSYDKDNIKSILDIINGKDKFSYSIFINYKKTDYVNFNTIKKNINNYKELSLINETLKRKLILSNFKYIYDYYYYKLYLLIMSYCDNSNDNINTLYTNEVHRSLLKKQILEIISNIQSGNDILVTICYSENNVQFIVT